MIRPRIPAAFLTKWCPEISDKSGLVSGGAGRSPSREWSSPSWERLESLSWWFWLSLKLSSMLWRCVIIALKRSRSWFSWNTEKSCIYEVRSSKRKVRSHLRDSSSLFSWFIVCRGIHSMLVKHIARGFVEAEREPIALTAENPWILVTQMLHEII